MDQRNDTPGKGMPSPPQPTGVPLEISSYADGQVIDFSPDDTRLYMVKSGTVQRQVQLPGIKGITPLELGKIQAGGYWQPLSAQRSAADFNMSLQFVAQGKTVVLKLDDCGLPKDKDKLLVVLNSLAKVSAQQIAAAEALIAHYYRLADQNAKEAGNVRAQNSLIESLREELENVQQQTNGLEQELKAIRALLKESESGRHSDRLEAAATIRQAQQEVADYSEWIKRNFPDCPVVWAGKFVMTTLDVDAEINRMFDQMETATAPFLLVPPKTDIIKPHPAIIVQTATEDAFETVGDEELSPLEQDQSDGPRLTQPMELSTGQTSGPPMDIPPSSQVATFDELCQTRDWGVASLPAKPQPSEPPRAWSDSLMDDALRDFVVEADKPQPVISPAPRPRMETLSFEDADSLPSLPSKPYKKGGNAPPLPSPPRK